MQNQKYTKVQTHVLILTIVTKSFQNIVFANTPNMFDVNAYYSTYTEIVYTSKATK